METVKLQYELTSESCDDITSKVLEFCKEMGSESKDALRYSLSVDECLLHWLNNGLEGNSVVLTMGKVLLFPVVQIEVEGANINTYENQDGKYR